VHRRYSGVILGDVVLPECWRLDCGWRCFSIVLNWGRIGYCTPVGLLWRVFQGAAVMRTVKRLAAFFSFLGLIGGFVYVTIHHNEAALIGTAGIGAACILFGVWTLTEALFPKERQ
jgi:hypothetical protein